MRIDITEPFTGTTGGSTDRDFWLPDSPISGGPDGFEVQGAVEIHYSSVANPAYLYGGVIVDYESTSGEAPRGAWLPETNGERRQVLLPVYAVVEWPQQQQHQIRFSVAAAHEGATVYEIHGDISLKRAGQLLA
jgi:hypothetical protein